MRIRWRGLELPSTVERDEGVSTDKYGRFIIEPFERGFGTTVGNSLRRILLSSLEGAAITHVKIAEAAHEFTTIPGILEDVTDIILNLKTLVVHLEGDEDKTMRLSHTEAGEVYAREIEADPAITLVNPDHLICTVTAPTSLNIEMTVGKGRGYVSAEEKRGTEQEIGVIPIDSIYSPVVRVRYRTEDTRVGQRTNYDRLIMEVWTRGTILPEDALVEAGKILRKHLNPFVMYHELGEQTVSTGPSKPEVPDVSPVDAELQQKWNLPIKVLNLSVRAGNCLESARILTLGALASKTEAELLRVRSFGRTSLREVQRKLAEHGLTLGMSGPSIAANPTELPEQPGDNPGEGQTEAASSDDYSIMAERQE